MEDPTKVNSLTNNPVSVPDVPELKQSIIPETEISEPYVSSVEPVAPTEVDEEAQKKMLSVKLSGQAHQALEHLAKGMSLTKTEVVELAVALFYRHYFEREACQLGDLQVFLTELTSEVESHADITANLLEMAIGIVDAEAELPSELLKT